MYKITEKERNRILKLTDLKKTPAEIAISLPHITNYYIKKTIKERNRLIVQKNNNKNNLINYNNKTLFHKIQRLKIENKTRNEILSICNITNGILIKTLAEGYEKNYLKKIVKLISEGLTKQQIEEQCPEVSSYYVQKIFSKTNSLKNMFYNSKKTMTLEEVGFELNLTKERIRQIQKEALNKLFVYFEENKMKYCDLI